MRWLRGVGWSFAIVGSLFAAFGAIMLLGMLTTAASGQPVPAILVVYLGISPLGMGVGSVIYGSGLAGRLLLWQRPAWMQHPAARAFGGLAGLLGFLPMLWL